MKDNDNKLLSIIIPAYNAGKKIDRCLGSIFKVDSKFIEVIVIEVGGQAVLGRQAL